jgi:DNA polymerase-3 subunit gamma/tau
VAPPSPPRSATPPSDAAALQQDWEAVLEAVKGVRRVAWILLRNATVQSLTDGVLTVRFPKEGDVKGFASSGCDADLKRVLAESFRLTVQVKAVSGADSGNASVVAGGVGDRENLRTVPAQPRPAPEPVPVKQARPVEPAPVPERAELDEGDPFDIDDPDASIGEADVTGMDLIKRELGGKIIDEIDNS